jgi:CRISPR-associated protein Cas1
MSDAPVQTQGGLEAQQPRYGRPALALDLMEEFRPLIADSVAISLVNRGELGPDDFIRSAGGTFLNDRGRKAFWETWFGRVTIV